MEEDVIRIFKTRLSDFIPRVRVENKDDRHDHPVGKHFLSRNYACALVAHSPPISAGGLDNVITRRVTPRWLVVQDVQLSLSLVQRSKLTPKICFAHYFLCFSLLSSSTCFLRFLFVYFAFEKACDGFRFLLRQMHHL